MLALAKVLAVAVQLRVDWFIVGCASYRVKTKVVKLEW